VFLIRQIIKHNLKNHQKRMCFLTSCELYSLFLETGGVFGCNTPGLTVTSTVHLQSLTRYLQCLDEIQVWFSLNSNSRWKSLNFVIMVVVTQFTNFGDFMKPN
jgi:hypothetical protein